MTQRGNAARRASQPAQIQQAPARPEAVLQRRGLARVQAILDAAEALMIEEGYAAATLRAAAERAGIPTASVYHYFADRHQVDAELVRRHIEALRQTLSSADSIQGLRSITDAASVVLDPMVEYFRSHPSAVELWFSGRSEAITALVDEFDTATAVSVWHAALEGGLLAEDTPLLVVRLAFEAGGRLFDLAFKEDVKGDDVIIAEAKRMATAYLETYASARPKTRRRSMANE